MLNFQDGHSIHHTFFDELWQQYQGITPQATRIHHLFESEGERVENDHVAFRTFANSPIDLNSLEPILLDLGFSPFDEYSFSEKKLFAKSYVHSECQTKVFLSELLWQQLSDDSQTIIARYIKQLDPNRAYGFTDGRLWGMPTYEEYCRLASESEYAAWMSVWGLRANHFTIYVNQLNRYNELAKVVELLEKNGYSLNQQGGVIKGSEAVGLMQSSTLADRVEVLFSCGKKESIPSCYYEFAQRFNVNGEIYRGFVTSSADKIFESTHGGSN